VFGASYRQRHTTSSTGNRWRVPLYVGRPIHFATGRSLRDYRDCRDTDESFALLGCYIALVCRCLLRDSLPVPSSRLRQPKNMRPIGCPETSINNYQTTLLKSPEERISSSLLSQFHPSSFFVFLLFFLSMDFFPSISFSAFLSLFISTRALCSDF